MFEYAISEPLAVSALLNGQSQVPRSADVRRLYKLRHEGHRKLQERRGLATDGWQWVAGQCHWLDPIDYM